MSRPYTYAVPVGSELLLDHVRWRVVGRDRDGYAVEGETGECCVLSVDRITAAIEAGDCHLTTPAMSEKRKKLSNYTSGIEHIAQLPEEEQKDIRARKGLVLAMERLEADGAKLTQRFLDRRDVREKLKTLARTIMGEPQLFHEVYIGNAKDPHSVPKGRTLQEMLRRFQTFDREPIVLLRKHHAKGPQGEARRKLEQLQEYFIFLVLEVYKDLTKPPLATIYNDMVSHYLEDYPDVFPSDFRVPSLTTIRTRLKQVSIVAQNVARNGYKFAKNRFGAGSPGTRALKYGESTATDQVYLSIFVDDRGKTGVRPLPVSEHGTNPAENEVRRIWLHILVDVATRYPLAWVLAETPDGDHQRSLMRMATRDKTREKLRYGCEHDPAPPVGLAAVKSDNGSATRNTDMYERLLGAGTAVQMNRTYNSTDNAFAERLIGTLQFQVLNVLPGYTGSRPGDLNGYDGQKEAQISSDDLMGIITRFFVDEYPHRPHRGTGMNKATPRQKLESSLAQYGAIPAPDWETRRLHLGERKVVSTTSEGVRVFGIWYNSSQLQAFAGGSSKTVTVCLDPDDLREVTIFSPDSKQKITAQLRMGEFADMTLEEAIETMVGAVEDYPEQRQIDQERLRRSRARRAAESGLFPNPRLPSNFRSIEQLEAEVARIGKVEFISMLKSGPTVPPGSIMDLPPASVPTRPLASQQPTASPEEINASTVPTGPSALSATHSVPSDPDKTKPMFPPLRKSKI